MIDKKYLILGGLLLASVAAYAIVKKSVPNTSSQLTPEELAALGLTGQPGSNQILAAHNQSALQQIAQGTAVAKAASTAIKKIADVVGIGTGETTQIVTSALSNLTDPVTTLTQAIGNTAISGGATAEKAAEAMAAAQKSIADSIAAGASPAEATAAGASTASNILSFAVPALIVGAFLFVVGPALNDLFISHKDGPWYGEQAYDPGTKTYITTYTPYVNREGDISIPVTNQPKAAQNPVTSNQPAAPVYQAPTATNTNTETTKEYK